MSDVVMAEQFDYPVLENTTNYTNRSSCLDKLDDQLGKLFRKTIKKTKDGKFSNMNRNKWNPADIWITKGDDIQTTHFRESDYETIGDLNKKIQELYDKKHLLVGIESLKQIINHEDTVRHLKF